MCSVGPRFYAHHQEQIHGFDCIIGMGDMNGPATRRDRQLFRVFHGEGSTICQMKVKRPKRFRGIQISQLFDGHVDILIGLLLGNNRDPLLGNRNLM